MPYNINASTMLIIVPNIYNLKQSDNAKAVTPMIINHEFKKERFLNKKIVNVITELTIAKACNEDCVSVSVKNNISNGCNVYNIDNIKHRIDTTTNKQDLTELLRTIITIPISIKGI